MMKTKSEKLTILEATLPVWVAVANSVLEREYGQEHEIRSGTKHFRGGAKIYLRRIIRGEKVEVVGRHRVSNRWITLVMDQKYLVNARAELLYNVGVLARLFEHEGHRISFTDSDESKQIAQELADFVGSKSQEFVSTRTSNHTESEEAN